MLIALVILVSLCLVALAGIFFYLTQQQSTQKLSQADEGNRLREALYQALGEQKADYRDTAQRNFDALRSDLIKRHEILQENTSQQLLMIQNQVRDQLKQNLEQNFGAFQEMAKSLSTLKSSADQMLAISQQVGELNQILTSPKMQGNFGETALEQLLSDILPPAAYAWQPRLAEGCQPDATLQFKQLKLCVDAKFPKDRIHALLTADTDEAREAARKELSQVVRLMISDIAKKYIRPELGTADMAMMFVPSETLYLEILKMPEITELARRQRVAITSPNTLAGLLAAVAMAFRGYEMQENARALVRGIQELTKHFDSFRQDFSKVGQRLNQATEDYQKAARDLERFDKSINRLKDGQSDSVPFVES